MRILVIGAAGIFGSRIVRELARTPGVELVLSGRRTEPLDALRLELGDADVRIALLDVNAMGFAAQLAALAPSLVIHAAGPFQRESDYAVARACIACASHYIDLADARDYVSGISKLDALARERDVLVVSGASTVPAISAAVVDAALPRFASIRSINHAIVPGNRTPRGEATVASILAMCGRPVPVWLGGTMQVRPGWSMTRRRQFAFGRRWVSLCDVPDLSLFPQRYPGVVDVVFRAGLELSVMHLGTWLLARLVGMGLIGDLANHARVIRRLSEWFLSFGSDTGGMQVEIAGTGSDGVPLTMCWDLTAGQGDGPRIPATPAVILANKLAAGQLHARGAQPCMGLFDLEDMAKAWARFDIISTWTQA